MGWQFEVILIAGMMHMATANDGSYAYQQSPLLERYKALTAELEDADAQSPDFIRASEIIKAVEASGPTLDAVMRNRTFKLGDAIQRLELVSRDLLVEG